MSDIDLTLHQDKLKKPQKWLAEGFLFGILAMGTFMTFIQDALGMEAYTKFLTNHWVNTPVWVFGGIFVWNIISYVYHYRRATAAAKANAEDYRILTTVKK